ncbi:hypothetical protein KIW74_gp29 [Mycobacterium phage Kimona]|uniref:Uncharacterized protein n=1 Tax=Mycobacterium phage Kimona TaxID=2024295 RepID=A0A249XU18_9CAUD|nr:hypothetical protein KIW74_gp29 [Mycobacterium phage Kimona]ASZ75499.1 hypothetical protein PBI_KIMONA_63 [Mycobacterium phage Kimona]
MTAAIIVGLFVFAFLVMDWTEGD